MEKLLMVRNTLIHSLEVTDLNFVLHYGDHQNEPLFCDYDSLKKWYTIAYGGLAAAASMRHLDVPYPDDDAHKAAAGMIGCRPPGAKQRRMMTSSPKKQIKNVVPIQTNPDGTLLDCLRQPEP